MIGVDLLGHGSAAKPAEPAAYAELEQSILAALPGAGQADALGFSMGAQLLLRAAASSPARFRRIVLAGVGDSVFAAADPEPVARAIEAGRAEPESRPGGGRAGALRPGARQRPGRAGRLPAAAPAAAGRG